MIWVILGKITDFLSDFLEKWNNVLEHLYGFLFLIDF